MSGRSAFIGSLRPSGPPGGGTIAATVRSYSGRGGTGIINLKVTDKTGTVVQVMEVGVDDQVVVITEYGKIIRTNVRDISLLGRPTQGVRLIHLDEGDSVVAVARVAEGDADQAVEGVGGTAGTAGGSGATPEGGNGADREEAE